MGNQRTLRFLLPAIFALALFAAAAGLFYETPGAPYPYTNHRGETVMINGHGLYYYDTVSSAAQMQGNDVVTLLVGLPLLAVSAWLALHGSLRGRLLLAGTLGFFLYTYLSMSTLTSYNALFLVYVTLFGLSLAAFLLTLLAVDVASLPAHFAPDLPRRAISGVLFAVGGFLTLAWLARIGQSLLGGGTPALENTTTLVIQALDLALIAPLAFAAGVLLWRGAAWGYLLASVAVLKGLTMALGVSAMGINMARRGVPDSLGILLPFLLLTAANLVVALILLRAIDRPVVAGELRRTIAPQ